MRIKTVIGVDFSGARLAGRNIWLASCQVLRDRRLKLASLECLEELVGVSEREPALRYLVERIRKSRSILWGMDFPFALPIEVMSAGMNFADQLMFVNRWKDDAYGIGRHFLQVAQSLGRENHIRRLTDKETKTPFDCYHYRIVCQTFHGMRDVLLPLSSDSATAIVPFQSEKVETARRIVAESCPGSTLKRLGLPHNRYKQPEGGPLAPVRRRTRRKIIDGLKSSIDFDGSHDRIMMRNAGGDALDAVIATVGAWNGWRTQKINDSDRYVLEGMIYI
jgi:hypothetical protein